MTADDTRDGRAPEGHPAAEGGTDDPALEQGRAGEIPGLLADLGRVLARATGQGDPGEAEAIEEAQRIASTLRRTAGAVGLAEVGAVADAVSVALKDLARVRRVRSSEPPEVAEGEQLHEPGRALIACVLLVDDDDGFLESVKAMGRENLVRVHTARSGAEAQDIAADHHLDGAIIDVALGRGEDAFRVARNLRSLGGLAELPIAFVSAEGSLPNRIAATHAGAALFLEKPLTAAHLLAAVRHLAPLEHDRLQRVLVVDDDERFLGQIAEILTAERMNVATLSDPTRILETIERERPDLLLLDVVMPQVSGFEVCRVLRSTDQWRELPVLFLTAHAGRDARVACFDSGGDDYIEKPVIREELLTRIATRLERVRMHRERADRDALTGLPTRRAFVEQFKMRLSEAHRFKRPVSLCLMDLDRFKEVNDTYGHLAGDRVLGGLGRLMASRFRAMDIRGRWGGEELVLAFYGEDAETTKMIVGRLKDELMRMRFLGDHGEQFAVTFSAGVAAYPDDGRTFEELFRVADRKLSAAKESGRDRIEI